MPDPEQTSKPAFSETQRLTLHQLRLLEWLAAQSAKEAVREDSESGDLVEFHGRVPEKWDLTRGVSLYEWQDTCIERWFSARHRGTVKVVTGGGKTLLAMAIAQRLQNTIEPDLRVAIVVPTIVLLHQWYDELRNRGNLPASAIGRLGGGYAEDLGDDRRILIAVLASARKQLPRLVKQSEHGDRLLLVADECHRLGAKEMSKVFEAPRAYNLGLSATPEREDDATTGAEIMGYGESLLGQELGPIIYDFTLAEALRLGIIPPFTIRHYGLPLAPAERARYDQLSRAISDTQAELRPLAPKGRSSGPGFFQWIHRIAPRRGNAGALAGRLVGDMARRRALLQGMWAREEAVQSLLREEFESNPDARAILFHESIDQVMRLFVRLHAEGFRAIAEHSRLPDSVREEGLDLFRKGTAQIIVSAKSLIEGFNVPAVDIGVIVASSASVRQRIQSLGRVLRRHRTPDGEEKTSRIHVLYARGTTEEYIYGKVDWDRTTGVKQNLYYHWDLQGAPELQDAPPRNPLPREEEVDAELLEPGCEYPGMYEGFEFSCDTQGNIQNADGLYARNAGDLPAQIMSIKGGTGRFKVTPEKHFVLVRMPQGDETWKTAFVTQLDEELDVDAPAPVTASDAGQALVWARSASPGDPYPFSHGRIVDDGLRFKRKQGGVITKRVPGGEVLARSVDRASDHAKGRDADNLLKTIMTLHRVGTQVQQLLLNEFSHVVYRTSGEMHFLYALQAGLEFPEQTS